MAESGLTEASDEKFEAALQPQNPASPATVALQQSLEEIGRQIQHALELLRAGNVNPDTLVASLQQAQVASQAWRRPLAGRVIEGVFNGEAMVGDDGKRYNIPPNYASKSKLVEGDILKLTIAPNGAFIYKQIGPIDREQLVGLLASDQLSGNWYAMKGDQRWRVLTASVTYFRGKPGDQAVVLVPKNSRSNWAAVDNIIAA